MTDGQRRDPPARSCRLDCAYRRVHSSDQAHRLGERSAPRRQHWEGGMIWLASMLSKALIVSQEHVAHLKSGGDFSTENPGSETEDLKRHILSNG